MISLYPFKFHWIYNLKKTRKILWQPHWFVQRLNQRWPWHVMHTLVVEWSGSYSGKKYMLILIVSGRINAWSTCTQTAQSRQFTFRFHLHKWSSFICRWYLTYFLKIWETIACTKKTSHPLKRSHQWDEGYDCVVEISVVLTFQIQKKILVCYTKES